MQSLIGGAPQRGGQLGHKVAHLVGVRHEHQLGLLGCDELLQRGGEGVGRVGFEFRRLDGVDFRDLLARDFVGEVRDSAADDGGFERPAGFGGQGLPGGEGLPGDAVQFAFTLFDDDQDRIRHDLRLGLQVRTLDFKNQFPDLSSRFSVSTARALRCAISPPASSRLRPAGLPEIRCSWFSAERTAARSSACWRRSPTALRPASLCAAACSSPA